MNYRQTDPFVPMKTTDDEQIIDFTRLCLIKINETRTENDNNVYGAGANEKSKQRFGNDNDDDCTSRIIV